ncbi:hypothetical protein NEHOM01_1001 [Nematocida homosporus]|uniref:uncharacterized protein n=1 Tax=Nematocida homosporus TaxID=1912981 RepID=UPI002221070B|nr:uncharacterized protein NEHOM01_1001 [Nematocida homosporus]KAI5185709.1 hypothetical protein NEHOM01_1001 [Nematocida homosporus]
MTKHNTLEDPNANACAVQREQEETRRRREKEDREKEEHDAYLRRIRELIQEDKKSNAEAALLKGQLIEQSVVTTKTPIVPLQSTHCAYLPKKEIADQITIKLIYDARLTNVVSLSPSTTLADLQAQIKQHFGLKKSKIYTIPKGELDLKNTQLTLAQLGIENMDVLHIQKG